MKKQQIIKELVRLYNYYSMDPQEWADARNEEARSRNGVYTYELRDYYPAMKGMSESVIRNILEQCGVIKEEDDE